MNIGTFRSGSLVKIPVSVTSPSNTTAYYNNTPVRLRGLTSVGGMKGGFMGSDNMITTSAGNCVGGSGLAGMACTYNTSAYGVALVVLNTSNITPALQSGSYSLVIEACTNASACWSADNWAGPNNDWERPQFEVRNFEVQGRLEIGRAHV